MRDKFNYLFQEKVLLVVTTCILFSYFLINLPGIYLTGPYGWDDGAITLAFARTLSENGAFALTSVSEIVEGSSSLFFVFLMTILYKLIPMEFNDFIFSSQIVGFIATCMMMILTYKVLASSVKSAIKRCLVVSLLGLLPMFTAEIFNGMEMSLLAFLMVALTVAFQSRSPLVFFLIPIILLTRFETVFYLHFHYLFCFLLRKMTD